MFINVIIIIHIYYIQGESISIDEALSGVELKAPFIAAFGLTKDELTDVKLVIESDNVISMPYMAIALHCCFASYYIYNISYPSDFSAVMLFLEQYVYRLKPS